jgi:hypothetical protein
MKNRLMSKTYIPYGILIAIFFLLNTCIWKSNSDVASNNKIHSKNEPTHFWSVDTCMLTNLSNKFNFQIISKSIHINGEVMYDSIQIKINIFEKEKSQLIQSINYATNTLSWLGDEFGACEDKVRSLVTSYNDTAEIVDGYPGYFVMADFNFDSNEDFCVARDAGGTNGPIYNYYLFNNDSFSLDNTLSNEGQNYVVKFDKSSKTLVARSMVGANCMHMRYFFYTDKKQWIVNNNPVYCAEDTLTLDTICYIKEGSLHITQEFGRAPLILDETKFVELVKNKYKLSNLKIITNEDSETIDTVKTYTFGKNSILIYNSEFETYISEATLYNDVHYQLNGYYKNKVDFNFDNDFKNYLGKHKIKKIIFSTDEDEIDTVILHLDKRGNVWKWHYNPYG